MEMKKKQMKLSLTFIKYFIHLNTTVKNSEMKLIKTDKEEEKDSLSVAANGQIHQSKVEPRRVQRS